MVKIEIDDNSKTHILVQNHEVIDVVNDLAIAINNIFNHMDKQTHSKKAVLVQAFIYAFASEWEPECEDCEGCKNNDSIS